MSIKANFDNAAVAFYRAHKAWKAAPDGLQKVEAKRALGKARSEFITAGDLHVPVEKKPPER
jgi:hypothetical protein